ncbi:MAG: efflux RND transporter periplasmic adaptor subunit [Flavobacteriales bacterium]|jgi:RND family efflux transporter MFP subunit|nr:efflux RND transporter periplasmic adaptor subunit [Flavobacteriales bacterium]MBK6549291.1 efflux RND transporter periplasmic adaptor subunit [Flavobacteriales bacterium]MBK6884131.1 efflux RND transporter periplasmic adaptor subunit [Flavobacteriales bacterium]MBK7100510.1 efflux RND transporter periplasmic adaptor subunit [Flavobacteriales bacterium]MBK7111207.1 efflux RND transporter periplasmic adaptor subunit [Flavobacteriales bacterium]
MKKILIYLIPFLLVVLVVIKLKSNKDIVQERVYHYDKERPIPVQSYLLKSGGEAAELNFTGTFQAQRESKLSAETQGKVQTVLVDVGSHVKKGESLIQLDNSLMQLQLRSVEVQIEGLEADVARYTVLTEADAIQGVQLEKAQLGLKAAKVQRNTLQEQIAKSTIQAPFPGVVTLKMTEVGAYAAPGIPLLQLTDLSELDFVLQVAEADLGLFQIGMEVTVSVDAFSDTKVKGRIRSVGSKGNMANSYPVQIAVGNMTGDRIRSGMFGKTVISSSSSEDQLYIPATALLGSNVNPQVYRIVDRKAVKHDVTLGRRIADRVQVIDGLKAGDEVVTGGSINLFDGAHVIATQGSTR